MEIDLSSLTLAAANNTGFVTYFYEEDVTIDSLWLGAFSSKNAVFHGQEGHNISYRQVKQFVSIHEQIGQLSSLCGRVNNNTLVPL